MVNTKSNKRENISTPADESSTSSTSKKQKSIVVESDIISNLPNDVLSRIVDCLPLRDAVRTSVLSKKWHFIWTSIPSLDFNDGFFKSVFKRKVYPSPSEFHSVISSVLLQHEGPIYKFSLSLPKIIHKHNGLNVTQWMPYLKRNGIKDFSLFNKHHSYLKLSSSMYTCAGLEKLKLHNCTLSSVSNPKYFPLLISLELEKVRIKCSTLNDLVASCPVLERLVVQKCNGMGNHRVIVDAPNLRHFAINCAFSSLIIKNGENLVSASIVARTNCCIDWRMDQENKSKLEMLALGGCICKVMFKQDYYPNKFEKLRNLELMSLRLNDLDAFLATINCIRSMPNIESLNISVCATRNMDANMLDYNPDATINHLSCATISIRKASNIEMKLIEYLLGCSPVLEQLSISFKSPVKLDTHSRVLMQLNELSRVSEKVQVVCHEPPKILPDHDDNVDHRPLHSGSSDYSSYSDFSDYPSDYDHSDYSNSDSFDYRRRRSRSLSLTYDYGTSASE